MNRQVRDTGTGMRLTERTRKLIPDCVDEPVNNVRSRNVSYHSD